VRKHALNGTDLEKVWKPFVDKRYAKTYFTQKMTVRKFPEEALDKKM
jgi:hypothetical protein